MYTSLDAPTKDRSDWIVACWHLAFFNAIKAEKMASEDATTRSNV